MIGKPFKTAMQRADGRCKSVCRLSGSALEFLVMNQTGLPDTAVQVGLLAIGVATREYTVSRPWRDERLFCILLPVAVKLNLGGTADIFRPKAGVEFFY